MKTNRCEISEMPEAVPPLVMVVDDEVLIRLVAVDMLRDAGFRVVEACSADEAIALLATDVAYDLIFTDVNMPGSIDGIGLVAYVKQRYPVVPVVVTSGGAAINELSKAGADAIIPKPYSEIALTRTIGRVLGKSGG